MNAQSSASYLEKPLQPREWIALLSPFAVFVILDLALAPVIPTLLLAAVHTRVIFRWVVFTGLLALATVGLYKNCLSGR